MLHVILGEECFHFRPRDAQHRTNDAAVHGRNCAQTFQPCAAHQMHQHRFSVIVGGALFGILGFILGTPIYAVFYSLIAKKARIKIEEKGKIAQEALDFKVLNYAEIAEEQRKIRAEKEQEQKRRLQKLLHLDFDEDDDDDDDDDGEKGASADEKAENFAETLNKH